jgi:2,5-diketo-D-gluconate reductase A
MPKPACAQVELFDGSMMPRLGLGGARITDERACETAVHAALDAGYRHFDTGQIYESETTVGRALRESAIERAELFVTTKFHPTRSDPLQELGGSLARMGLDYVDLYLVHWPQDSATAAWPGMVRALEAGLTRSIGVSNFSLAEVDELLETTSTRPAVNQVQFNPFRYRRGLVEGCAQRGISVVAYAPLGMKEQLPLENPAVVGVAARLGRTPAQIMLRWGLQRGVSVIPKSEHPNRILSNSQIFDFCLDQHSLDVLDALDVTGRTDRAREVKFWEK